MSFQRHAKDRPNAICLFSSYMRASTMYSIIHLHAIASHLPVTLIMNQYTGRWAHLNVKLLHFFLVGHFSSTSEDSSTVEYSECGLRPVFARLSSHYVLVFRAASLYTSDKRKRESDDDYSEVGKSYHVTNICFQSVFQAMLNVEVFLGLKCDLFQLRKLKKNGFFFYIFVILYLHSPGVTIGSILFPW